LIACAALAHTRSISKSLRITTFGAQVTGLDGDDRFIITRTAAARSEQQSDHRESHGLHALPLSKEALAQAGAPVI
jgi:hypothetical protein